MNPRETPNYHRGTYLSIAQRVHRLSERLAEVTLWVDRAQVAVAGWTIDDIPLAIGAEWPDRTGVHTIAVHDVVVPEAWPLNEVRLDLSLGGEGLVSIETAGTVDRFGLDPYHHRFPVRGRQLAVDVQIVARRPFGEPNREPRLDRARLTWVDTPVNEFASLIATVLEAVEVLGDNEAVAPILGCVERALATLDWPSRTADYVARASPSAALQEIWELPADLEPSPPGLTDIERASVIAATGLLQADLAALRSAYPPHGAILFTGHAHLDMAWLWPLDETRRKARRTAWTVVNLMQKYPEFTFNQSSAQLYRFIGEDDPELLEAIAKAVGERQWEPIGGMWVETDGNLPCGESFVRQLLYGQRTFEELFGARHQIGWLPDTFGLSAGLPQILASAGICSLFSQKLNRADTTRFPYDLYWWEGLDGTRLLVHSFDNPNGSYDAMLGPDAMVRTWQNYRGKHIHPETLISIGYGDGGGGPTAEMIERARHVERFPALPKGRFGRVADLFDRLHETAAHESLPVWVGELYLEFHRGTYTAQGRVKRLHRRVERSLIAAEALGTLHALVTGERPDSMAPFWETLLLNQFHDILPGSSIREVNIEAEEQLSGILDRAEATTAAHLEALARAVVFPGAQPGVVVVNPDLAARPLRLEVDVPVAGMQPVDGGAVAATTSTIAGLEVAVVVDLAPAPGLSASTTCLENEHVRLDIDETGVLARVYDKKAGREALADRGNQLWAYVDKPRLYDAWEIDASYTETGRELAEAESVELVESGPHRAAVRVRRSFRSSTIVQEIRLWANSPRIDFHTLIDWHDRHWLLKARFPLAVRADQATFETAFGVVRRPTHRNTAWDAARYEVPAHRFADLSEPGYGVALLNDGRYGYDALGSELGISLLRSPVYPDPLADEGRHEFTYALLPHYGNWYEGGVLAEAEDLNSPLLSTSVQAAGSTSSRPIRIDGVAIALGALKPSEDGADYVLRCYEPSGARGAVTIALPQGWTRAGQVTVLEDDIAGSNDGLDFGPFQLRSWRLTRTY